jgi:putative ABC transport system permease protein
MSQRLPRGIRRLFRLGSVERDLEEELSSYFAHAVEELCARGYSQAQAEEEAHRRFGDESRYRDELRAIDADRERAKQLNARFDALRESVTSAARSWRRAPGLALGLILVFALGIGANGTMYSIVDRLLLSPPAHIVDAGQVKRLYAESYVAFMGKRFATSTISYPEYREVSAAIGFEKVAALSDRQLIVGNGEAAEEAAGVWASGAFFSLLGVKPALGRFYSEAEDKIGGAQVAVLGYSYWQSKYAGARAVIGRTIDFGYGPYTIIGVAPRGFTGVDLARVDVWLPLHVAAAAVQGTEWENERGWGWFQAIARLAPGTTVERASAEASALHSAAWSDAVARGDYNKDPSIVLAPVLNALGPDHGSEPLVARLLLAVSLVVLLIACVNVANLMIARTIRQQQEIAVRLALGISRARLVLQLLFETLLVSLAGGAAALLLSRWGAPLVGRLLLPAVTWSDVGFSRGLVLSVFLIALVVGVLTGLVPALRATYGGLSPVLRRATAGGISRTSARVRAGLVVLQTALSVVLLFGASVFVRSMSHVNQLDLGFDVDGLYLGALRVQPGSVKPEERRELFERGVAELQRVPGVKAVGVTAALPFTVSRTARLRVQGVDSVRKPPSGGPFIYEVSPTYLRAMGLQVLQGRGFNEHDVVGAPRVALVNQSMARYFWPGENAIGKCLYIGREESPCSTVVGVVEDGAHMQVRPELTLQYYTPIAQRQDMGAGSSFVIRYDESFGSAVRALSLPLLHVDPRVRYAEIQSMRERVAPQTRAWLLGAAMFSVFGLLALFVAAIGLYSVLAFDVAQRTRELGVRAALGATRPRLVRMVVDRSLRVTAAGIVIGSAITLSVAGSIQQLLFRVPARDPWSIATVAALLLLVAIAAGVLPGLRAARVDPSTALRS